MINLIPPDFLDFYLLLVLTFVFFAEESDGAGVDGEGELPDGHHREGLLWPPVHRPQPRQPLDRPNQASQEADKE